MKKLTCLLALILSISVCNASDVLDQNESNHAKNVIRVEKVFQTRAKVGVRITSEQPVRFVYVVDLEKSCEGYLEGRRDLSVDSSVGESGIHRFEREFYKGGSTSTMFSFEFQGCQTNLARISFSFPGSEVSGETYFVIGGPY